MGSTRLAVNKLRFNMPPRSKIPNGKFQYLARGMQRYTQMPGEYINDPGTLPLSCLDQYKNIDHSGIIIVFCCFQDHTCVKGLGSDDFHMTTPVHELILKIQRTSHYQRYRPVKINICLVKNRATGKRLDDTATILELTAFFPCLNRCKKSDHIRITCSAFARDVTD